MTPFMMIKLLKKCNPAAKVVIEVADGNNIKIIWSVKNWSYDMELHSADIEMSHLNKIFQRKTHKAKLRMQALGFYGDSE